MRSGEGGRAETRGEARREPQLREARRPSARVLVLDANERSALAATRSLGRRGVPVVAADAIAHTLSGASRYCRERFSYPSPSAHPDEFVEAVRSAVAGRDIGVVLPMAEVTTELLVRRRDTLGRAIVPVGDLHAFEQLNDKRQLADLARKLEIPAPRTTAIDDLAMLDSVADQLTFPAVVKPFRSRIPTADGWLAGSVHYAASKAELSQLVRSDPVFRAHPFLLQEYIAGRGQGVFALYEKGRAVTFFAHRRVRERPPSGGVSVVSESVAVDPELRRMATLLLDHVAWHGVAMVEFKITPRGDAFLMEVNPRFWGSLQLAIDAGVDFPWLVYQMAEGALTAPVEGYRLGVRNRWVLGDVDHLYLRLRDEPSFRARWQALRTFLTPVGPGARHEVNRWEDPRPFLTELRQYVFGVPGR